MFKKFREQLKENSGVAFTTIANVGSSFTAAIFWFLLASILNVESYGSINYDLAIPYILSTAGAFGLNITIVSLAPKGNKEIVSQSVLIILISELSLAIGLFFVNWIYSLVLLGSAFFITAMYILLGYHRYKEYAFASIAARIAQVILSLFLFEIIGVDGVILGIALANLAFSYRFFYEIKPRLKFDVLRKYRQFATYNFATELAHTSYSYADKLVIGSIFGYIPLGLYQLGLQFMHGLGILPSSLSMYILPEEARGSNKRIVKVYGLVFSGIFALMSFFLIPYVIELFFSNFSDAINAIRIIIFGIIPMTVTSILSSSLLGREQGKPVLYGTIIYVSVQLPTLIILGNILRIEGFAISVVLSQCIQALSLWLLNGKKLL